VKRLALPTSISIPPVRLHLGDLRELLEKVGPTYELTASGYEFDSLDDLLQNVTVEQLPSLVIATYQKLPFASLRVNIRPLQVSISCDEPFEEKAAFVAHYLRQRSPWYLWTVPDRLWWHLIWSTAVSAMAYLVGNLIYASIPVDIEGRWVIALTVGMCVYVFGMMDRFRIGRTRIALYAKGSKPTLWQRKREDWISEAVKILVTAGVSFLLGRLSK
jgi:hypothetical protein